MIALMMVAPINHIALDESHRAFVTGSGVRISMLARDVRAGMSAGDLAAAYPQLTLAQIHAGLSYYYDNQTVIDEEIAGEDTLVERSREEVYRAGRSFSRSELEARRSPRRAS